MPDCLAASRRTEKGRVAKNGENPRTARLPQVLQTWFRQTEDHDTVNRGVPLKTKPEYKKNILLCTGINR